MTLWTLYHLRIGILFLNNIKMLLQVFLGYSVKITRLHRIIVHIDYGLTYLSDFWFKEIENKILTRKHGSNILGYI